MNNPYSKRIVRRIESQTDKGFSKYGATMQDNPLNLTILEVVEYALEEVADCAVYLEKVKEMLRGSTETTMKAQEKDRKAHWARLRDLGM